MNYNKEKLSAEEICTIKFALRNYTPPTELRKTRLLLSDKLNRSDYFMMLFTRKKRIRTKTEKQPEQLTFQTEIDANDGKILPDIT